VSHFRQPSKDALHAAATHGAEREKELVYCSDAMKTLHQATRDLTQLVQSIDLFAEWWLEMDTMLAGVSVKVAQIQADRIVRLRVASVRSSWTEVKQRYSEYKVKVAKLQDFYPSSRNSIENAHNASRGAVGWQEG